MDKGPWRVKTEVLLQEDANHMAWEASLFRIERSLEHYKGLLEAPPGPPHRQNTSSSAYLSAIGNPGDISALTRRVSEHSIYIRNNFNNTPPVLSSYELEALRTFKTKYEYYVRKCPYPDYAQPVTSLLSAELFEFMERRVENWSSLSNERALLALVNIHRPRSLVPWLKLVRTAQIQPGETLTRARFARYLSDFNWYAYVAGPASDVNLVDERQLVEAFIYGLNNSMFHPLSELGIKSIDPFVVIATEYVENYCQAVETYQFTPKTSSKSSTTLSESKSEIKSAKSIAKEVRSDPTLKLSSKSKHLKTSKIQCYNCHKFGHISKDCPMPPTAASKRAQSRAASVEAVIPAPQISNPSLEAPVEPIRRTIQVYSSDVPTRDEFLRIPVAIGPNGDALISAQIFIDTGANINSITRSELSRLESALKVSIPIVQAGYTTLYGAANQRSLMSGEMVSLVVQFTTALGPVQSTESFYVLKQCIEPLAFGIQSTLSLLGSEELVSLLNAKRSVPETDVEAGLSTAGSLFPMQLQQSTAPAVNIDPSFPLKTELQKVIDTYGQVLFADFDRKGMSADPLDISLVPGAQVKVQSARFIAPDLVPKVKAEIDRQVSWGVLEPVTDVKCASPLVICRKPDGGIRLAVDYRELNAVIEPNANQLPLQELLFSKLAHQRYFVKVDNLWGYHQLSLTPWAQELCVINTPWGLYKMVMLGFGIKTAPGAYHQRMYHIIGDLFLNGLVVYIDDTLIYATTPEELIARVDKVFRRLADANVRLKPSKCVFGVSEVEFLGHVFNQSGYHMSEDRKASIMSLESPTSMKALRSFIGIVNYFRSFIPHLSILLAPLTDQLKNRSHFTWSPALQHAFESVKQAISSATALAWPNDIDPLILYTDASIVGLGGMFVQEQKGVEVPLAFVSEKFCVTASRWSTIEQECFAVVFCGQTLRASLLGRHFFLKTDHKNLLHLSSS